MDAKLDVQELETRGLALSNKRLIQQINWCQQFDVGKEKKIPSKMLIQKMRNANKLA